MAECYRLPDWILIGMSMLLALCVVVQSMTVAYSLRRLRTDWVRRAENLLEIVLLVHLFLGAALIARVQCNAAGGFLLPGGYEAERRCTVLLTAILSTAAAAGSHSLWPLGTAAAAVVGLPAVEQAAGAAYPGLFLLAEVYLLLRGLHICFRRQRQLRTTISVNSVKEAIDGLHTGLLFCRPEGEILLCNRQMEGLLRCCTGAYVRDGSELFSRLQTGTLAGGCTREKSGGQTALRLPDGSVWLFRQQTLPVKRSLCTLLMASDITQQWDANRELAEKNRELERQGEELRQVLDDLRAACASEALLRGKVRVHDALGQRVSLLLRALREGREPDETMLADFAEGLPRSFWEKEAQSPGERLESLTAMFRSMGVEVLVQGTLPQQPDTARAFADIAAECVTNAVRHGYATQVRICFSREDGWQMSCTDNGVPPTEPIREGGGIREMRRWAAELGGSLRVTDTPRFCIQISVPRGDKPI